MTTAIIPQNDYPSPRLARSEPFRPNRHTRPGEHEQRVIGFFDQALRVN